MRTVESLTKAEENFTKEMTRKLLVGWCNTQLTEDIEIKGFPGPRLYLRYAQTKKWVSADGRRVLAAGLNVAAAFLRR